MMLSDRRKIVWGLQPFTKQIISLKSKKNNTDPKTKNKTLINAQKKEKTKVDEEKCSQKFAI